MSLLTLPPPPKSWDTNKDYVIHSTISPCYKQPIEPAGREFMAVARRHRHKRTLSEDERIEQALEDASAEDVSMEEDEPETPKLLRSDPLKWKEQDHYAVLGLSKIRWKASEEDIKRAYRRKVLKHHPDKNPDGSDSFFKCVQQAWEVMSDPVKRRQWDSVDPKFDDSIPSAKAKGDFYEIYTLVFEKEARFSKTQPVPGLGDSTMGRDEVESFYNFWFNFDSWRSFENLDEEDTDNVESREEKRWLERRNKAERTKRKKADNSRVNKLVEQAFQADPRIKKFREDDKFAKEAKKREKEAALRAAEEEAKRKAEAEQAAKEKAEAEEKARQQAEKKEREAAKNAVRKEKKAIKRIMRDNNNFLPSDASPEAVATQLQKLDEIMEFLDNSGLEQFRGKLEEAAPGGAEDLILVFDEEHLHMEESKQRQKAAANASREEAKHKEDEKKSAKAAWSVKETATLIKAVKLFPGGTIDRWEKIAEYINEHGGEEDEDADTKASRQRTPKEAISQSKVVQSAQAAERSKLQLAVKKPVAKVEIAEKPTERVDDTTAAPAKLSEPAKTAVNGSASPALATNGIQPSMPAPPNAAWSTEQQIALEQAMRKYPAAKFRESPNERWEKIALEVPGKTKKEIKQRVKELAEMVKKKKQQS